MSAGSKDRVGTDARTDTTDRIIVRANAVGNYLLGAAAKTTV